MLLAGPNLCDIELVSNVKAMEGAHLEDLKSVLRNLGSVSSVEETTTCTQTNAAYKN